MSISSCSSHLSSIFRTKFHQLGKEKKKWKAKSKSLDACDITEKGYLLYWCPQNKPQCWERMTGTLDELELSKSKNWLGLWAGSSSQEFSLAQSSSGGEKFLQWKVHREPAGLMMWRLQWQPARTSDHRPDSNETVSVSASKDIWWHWGPDGPQPGIL